MREQFTRFKLMNRYTMDFIEAFTISTRSPGWKKTLAQVIGRYWRDFSTRRLTRRDRYLSLGAALIGPMRKLLMDRGVEVRLGTTVKKLLVTDNRVTGVEVERLGRRSTIHARHGVIVCAGGFEWNQALRNRFFTIPGDHALEQFARGSQSGRSTGGGSARSAPRPSSPRPAGGCRRCRSRSTASRTSRRSIKPCSMSGGRTASASIAMPSASSMKLAAMTGSATPCCRTSSRPAPTRRAGWCSTRPSAKNSPPAASCRAHCNPTARFPWIGGIITFSARTRWRNSRRRSNSIR